MTNPAVAPPSIRAPRFSRAAGLSVLASLITVVLLSGVGGWMRRWMSDDGLIVLRTVRNLQAGHGPVFNIGERVEANTSTLWQYIIYVGAQLTGARLESVALYSALGLTVVAGVIAVLATARLYDRRYVLFPLGMVVYFALPPARDFATSGLEWGLSIAYLATLWAVLLWWARSAGQASSRALHIAAFVAGLSWLVRPELALYGAASILLLLIASRRWTVLPVGGALPVVYEIFRMGYYGAIVPQTAVAKSASGSDWHRGIGYLRDFVEPYHLIGVGLLLFAMIFFIPWKHIGVTVGATALDDDEVASPRSHIAQGETASPRTASQLGEPGEPGQSRHNRTPRPGLHKLTWIVAALFFVCAALHALYVLRVGGDFMHGRMWLLPMFAGMLPMAVFPVWGEKGSNRWVWALMTIAAALWGLARLGTGHEWEIPSNPVDLNIVDERVFWLTVNGRTGDDPVLYAEDFLHNPRMNGFTESLAATNQGGVADMILVPVDGEVRWITIPSSPNEGQFSELPPTITNINLGMTAMNAPLDVRVLDIVGLSTPVAARQPVLEDARIGHNKLLPEFWFLAESAADPERLPEFVDKEQFLAVRHALRTPEFQELFASYREPMSLTRFVKNMKFSLMQGRTMQINLDPQVYRDVPESDQPIVWSGRS